MAEETALREALAANLASIAGLQQSAYVLSAPSLPAVEVVPGPIDYDRAMGRGTDEWAFIVRALVGITTDIGGQKLLGKLRASSGATSVKAALESDKTLGGIAQTLHVPRVSGQLTFGREGRSSAIGAEWTVQVFAGG